MDERKDNVYEDIMNDVQSMIMAVSQIIDNHPNLKERNFGLYYQHGRLGYVDLDAFAESVDLDAIKKAREEKITEDENTLDKIEE
jgi:hypothetical protein